MGGIFSKESKKSKPKSTPPPKAGTITPLDRAILDLKNSRDRLTKYRTKLNADTAKLASRAKSLHADGQTSYALHLLRLRKYKLQECDRVDEQLLTVLRMVDQISQKQNEQEVVAAMKRGKDALQILHDQMGVDDILELMDDIRDQDEVEKRINEALSGEELRGVSEMEEEDILKELEMLEEEVRLESEFGKEEVKAEAGEESLPAVPTKPLPEVKEQKITETEAKVAVAS